MGDYLQGKVIPQVKNEDALLSVQPGSDLSLRAECQESGGSSALPSACDSVVFGSGQLCSVFSEH